MKTPELPVVGRETELAFARRAFETAAATPVPVTLVVDGPSGIGKSALLDRIAAGLGASAAVIRARGHRIQRGMPFAIVGQLVGALVAGLDDRYRAGTENAPDPGARLLALLEGITLDRPVSIVIDDAQWMDDESAGALESAVAILADRPLFVVEARRTDALPQPVPAGVSHLRLRPLAKEHAAAIVRAVYADAPEVVVDAIVAHAGGLPLDVIALAEGAADGAITDAAAMSVATRTVVARRVDALDPALRTFLQTLSLLPDAVEYDLLRTLWPEEELAAHIAAAERYLVVEGTKISFRHALVARAVVETIALKVPLRRRIVEALLARRDLAIGDRLVLVEQALALADAALARGQLLAVVREANERGQVRLVISAAARLLEIGEPDDADLLEIYGSYAKALLFLDHNGLAAEVLERALRQAVNRKIGHVGPLVAQLLLAQWFGGDPLAARETYRYYAERLPDPADAVQLHAAGLWIAVCDHDLEAVEEANAAIAGAGIELSAEVRARMEIARMFVASRNGDYVAARAMLTRVEAVSREIVTANRRLPEFLDAHLKFTQFGLRYDEFLELSRRGGSESEHYNDHYLAHAAILAGRLDDALLIVEQGLRRNSDPGHRRRLLAAAAAAYALRGEDGVHRAAIDAELRAFDPAERGASLIAMAAWCAALPGLPEERAEALADEVLAFVAEPFDPLVLISPLGPVVAAYRRGDRAALGRIAAARIWRDRRRAVDAERRAAEELARILAGEKRTADAALVALCDELGFELPSLLLRATSGDAAAHDRLDALGIAWMRRKAKAERAPAQLTARERQIAERIAEGRTNREIAELLVLSERTVEGHIASIFNRLGVSSRTQIASWYLRTSAGR